MVAPGAETLPQQEVLGVPVAVVSMESAVAAIGDLLESPELDLVFTADSQGIYLAQKDEELREAYHASAFNTPDSNGVTWALRRQGVSTARVTGVDLAERLLALCAERGHSVFLLGAAPGVAEEAARQMRTKYPDLIVAGTRDGFWRPDEEQAVVQLVKASGARLLLVALGIPRQEKFLVKYRHELGARVGIGVGGTFDVWSGRVKRAPRAVQTLRMEWLWRVLQNPRKMGKVAVLPRFALRVLKARRS